MVAEAAAQTLAGVKGAPCAGPVCRHRLSGAWGIKRFCPDAQVTCVEKRPEAFRYLEQNVRTALPGAAPAVQAVQGAPVHPLAKPAGRAAGPDACPTRRI